MSLPNRKWPKEYIEPIQRKHYLALIIEILSEELKWQEFWEEAEEVVIDISDIAEAGRKASQAPYIVIPPEAHELYENLGNYVYDFKEDKNE